MANTLANPATGRRSFVGGLTKGAASASAPNTTGPASGGYLIIPLLQKRAESGGGLNEDSLLAPVALEVVASQGRQQVVGDGTEVTLRNGSTVLNPSVHANGGATTNHITSAEGSTKGFAGAVFTGFAWTSTATAVAARQFSRGGTLNLFVAGSTSAAQAKYSEIVLCAVRGYRYDPDNTVPPTAYDPPYISTKD